MRSLALALCLSLAACTPAQGVAFAGTSNKILAAARAVCRFIGALPDVPMPDAGAHDASLPPVPNADVAPSPSAVGPVSSGGAQ